MILVLGVAFFNSAPRGRLPGGAGASLQRISARAVLGLQSSTADAADSTEKQKDVAGDAEIERLCASYKVPQPPPFRPELAARAAEAIAVLRRSGTHAALGNTSFVALIKDFTIEERERLAVDSGQVAIYFREEVPVVKKGEEVRTQRACPLRAAA